MKQGWEIKKLGDIAKFYRGLTYSKGDEVPSSTNMVLRSNNVDLETNALVYDDMKCLREDLLVDEDKKVKANSILICMSNGSKQHIGKVAYIQDNIDYAFGGFMGLIVPTKDIEGKYLYYSCVSHHFKHFLAGIGNGIGITNLRFSDLSSYCFPVPPIAEQEKIVAELDCLSGIIEKKKQQLKELDNLAQSIFYEMFGNPVENDKGWKVLKLKELSSLIINGTTPKGGAEVYVDNGILFLRSQNVWRNHIDYEDVAHIDEKTNASMKKSILHKHDILITKTGRINTENSSLGRAALFEGETGSANINGHVYLIRINEKLVLSRFVLSILTGIAYRDYIRKVCVGGIDKRQINKEHVEEFPIIIPSVSMQKQYVETVEAIEKQKELIKQSIQETETLFNSRMDYYFN
jgi:restriction endonuclease S subunit